MYYLHMSEIRVPQPAGEDDNRQGGGDHPMDQPSIPQSLQPFLEAMEKRLGDQIAGFGDYMAGLEQRLLQRLDGMDAHIEEVRLHVKDLEDARHAED